MSYWVYLEDENGKPLQVENHAGGGTFTLGGTTDAELNVTYNYGPYIRRELSPEGLRWLHKKTGRETYDALVSAVGRLGVEHDEDYWLATPGNAGKALNILAGWAKQHPEGVWSVS